MGKNPVPGNRKPGHSAFPRLARAAAGAALLAASVYAVNLSAGSAAPAPLAASFAGAASATGAYVPARTAGTGTFGDREGEAAPPASDQVAAGVLPPVITSDPRATVTFPHPSVGGPAREEPGALGLGPAGTGRPPAGFLMAPLQFLYPSSPFGFRVSPISGAAGDFHLGQDYAAACGTPVYAADSGVVRAAGWHPWGGGNRVEIDHGDGLITTYNHLGSIGVHAGDKVQVGQAIARVGTTGWSTGCHLHFEAILNGRYTNPLRWTFLQLRPLNQALQAGMVSYAPGQGAPAGRSTWTIPLQVDLGTGIPAAGIQASLPPELTVTEIPTPREQLTTTAQPSAGPTLSAAPPSSAPAPSDSAPPPPTPAPTATATASPAPAPTATATASPAPTSTPSPTPTAADPAPTLPAGEPSPPPVLNEPLPTAVPTRKFSSWDPYTGVPATNSPYEESSADTTAGVPLSDSTDP